MGATCIRTGGTTSELKSPPHQMWWGFVVFTVGRRSLFGFSTSGWRFHVFWGCGYWLCIYRGIICQGIRLYLY